MYTWTVTLLVVLLMDSILFANIIKPSTNSGNEVNLIIIPSPKNHDENYLQIAKVIESQTNQKLWIKIVESSSILINKVNINTVIQDGIHQLQEAGSNARYIFIAAHGGSGELIQNLNLKNQKIDGFIFLASYIQRHKRSYMENIPSLTIGGSLDGITRITRIAESFYKEILDQKDQKNALLHNPIVIINGMNHHQFSNGDTLTSIFKSDLKAEIDLVKAHHQVAKKINQFINYRLNPSNENKKNIKLSVQKSKKILDPLIESLILEGNYYLKSPCSKVKIEDCFYGSPWVTKSFLRYTHTPKERIKNIDEFRNVWRVFPFFHPSIENSCQKFDETCILKTRTISQAVYQPNKKKGFGSPFVAAQELRVKFKSRQSIHEALGQFNVDVKNIDGFDTCKDLNQFALDWGLQKSSSEALARYNKLGTKMVIGNDMGPYINGPKWIWTPLSMEFVNNELIIRSPSLMTSMDYPISKIRGFQYCKLLSPAKVLEWIYIDSLRPHYLNN